MGTKKKFFLLLFITAIAGCTYQAAVILNLGRYTEISSARAVFLTTENSLEQLGFIRQLVPDANSRSTLARSENEKFISSFFIDPKAPSGRPQGWYAQVLLSKNTNNTVEVVLAQPGAEKPSEALAARGIELLQDLQKSLPSIPMTIK